MKAAKFKETDILPEYSRTNTDIDMTTDDIFDKLGVEKLCCRMHINTGTYFVNDVYGVIPGMPDSEPESSKKVMDSD